MEKERRRYFDVRIVIGILIIVAGSILLLDSLNIGIAVDVWDYWPLILIVIGVGKLLEPQESRSYFWGIIFTAVGVLFLLNNLGYIDFWFDDLWPIILILIGLAIIKGGLFRHGVRVAVIANGEKGNSGTDCCRSSGDSQVVGNNFIDISAILGGWDHSFSSKKLKGGRASAIMGGCDIDLRNADMEGDSMVVEASAIMGGVEIRVPSHWQVVMRGTPILGAMENKTKPSEDAVKKLIVNGSVIMGAIEVTN